MKDNKDNSPLMVLVRPQLPQNIGMCARAMKNFCQNNLALVNPREGSLVINKQETLRASSGACDIINNTAVHSSIHSAVQNCHFVYSLSNRAREINKQSVSLKQACKNTANAMQQGQKVAFLFGPEASGLSNEDIENSNYLISIETNKNFTSLNLSQSVMLVCYEIFNNIKNNNSQISTPKEENASQEHYNYLFKVLEEKINNKNSNKIVSNRLKNIFLRSNLTLQEINLLHLLLK